MEKGQRSSECYAANGYMRALHYYWQLNYQSIQIFNKEIPDLLPGQESHSQIPVVFISSQDAKPNK